MKLIRVYFRPGLSTPSTLINPHQPIKKMFNHTSNHRNRPPFAKGAFFISLVAAGVLLFGLAVMLLWNAILPKVTSASPLTYWQAVGLLALSRILFGGFRFGKPGRPPFGRSQQMREKWMSMSDEERVEFKAKWKERCGRPKPE